MMVMHDEYDTYIHTLLDVGIAYIVASIITYYTIRIVSIIRSYDTGVRRVVVFVYLYAITFELTRYINWRLHS